MDLHEQQVEKNNNFTPRTGDSAGEDPMVLQQSPTSGGPWEAEDLQKQQELLKPLLCCWMPHHQIADFQTLPIPNGEKM